MILPVFGALYLLPILFSIGEAFLLKKTIQSPYVINKGIYTGGYDVPQEGYDVKTVKIVKVVVPVVGVTIDHDHGHSHRHLHEHHNNQGHNGYGIVNNRGYNGGGYGSGNSFSTSNSQAGSSTGNSGQIYPAVNSPSTYSNSQSSAQSSAQSSSSSISRGY